MNEEQIAELEKSIDYCRRSIESQTETMNIESEQLKQLKKEAEVKPVFPNRENCNETIYSFDVDSEAYEVCGAEDTVRLSKRGMTFSSSDCCMDGLDRARARAYVIEAINKSNRGNNGFNAGEKNYYFAWDGSAIDFGVEQSTVCCERALYVRSEIATRGLLASLEFCKQYKKMLGIK
jgi:hypothetical protein